jgi:hypothetical protein
MTGAEPHVLNGEVELQFQLLKRSVHVLVTNPGLLTPDDIARSDFIVSLFSFAEPNWGGGLDSVILALDPLYLRGTVWIFVGLDPETKEQSWAGEQKLKQSVAQMGAHFMEASLRRGLGLDEVFDYIAKGSPGKSIPFVSFIHRDIKPDIVGRATGGQMKSADGGLSR